MVFNENTEALMVLIVEKLSVFSQLVTTIGVQLSQGCCWNILVIQRNTSVSKPKRVETLVGQMKQRAKGKVLHCFDFPLIVETLK